MISKFYVTNIKIINQSYQSGLLCRKGGISLDFISASKSSFSLKVYLVIADSEEGVTGFSCTFRRI